MHCFYDLKYLKMDKHPTLGAREVSGWTVLEKSLNRNKVERGIHISHPEGTSSVNYSLQNLILTTFKSCTED